MPRAGAPLQPPFTLGTVARLYPPFNPGYGGAMLTRDADGAALLGGVPLQKILEPLGTIPTPAYVYDLDAIAAAARRLAAGFGSARHLIAYAVKANTAGPIVRALAEVGCGADVVSGGELSVALGSGITPDRILFSGVGKTAAEIDRAVGAGDRGILAIQIESVEEIGRIEARAAALGRRARTSIRVNPGVEADTHTHIATGHDEAKFGVAREDLPAAWDALRRATHVDLIGLSCHVGSQLTRTDAYLAAADALLEIAILREAERGSAPSPAPLAFVDFGGGFGVDYGAGCAAEPAEFVAAAVKRLTDRGAALRAAPMIVTEPGRALVAAYGVLCAGVIMSKRSATGRRWLMIDAGMNDLIRPALYGALHRIEPIGARPPDPRSSAARWRVVGPVCESSDDFGEHPFGDAPPDQVVIRDAGAYGFTMANQYNGRALPAEVFLQGGQIAAISEARSVEAWVESRTRIGITAAAK